jgi:flagellum-specific peptidoglycan hydrolase FlgJ
MKNRKSTQCALLLTLLLAFTAPAFALYKCEAGGKVTYSDEPCPGGKVLDIDRTPPIDAAKANKQAAQEKKQAERIDREQRKRDAQEERDRRQAAKLYAAKQNKCMTLAQRQKWADEDITSATRKSIDKTKRRARRAAEQYQMECGKPDVRALSATG